MVQGDVVNICANCDQELVGREEVESIVGGKVVLRRMRAHMRWVTYMCCDAFMYVEVQGKTGSCGATKNIVCGCNAKKADSPSMTMIRQEFREQVRKVFGADLSLPFLFQLPPSVVAWENSALVKAKPSENGMVLSDEGIELLEIIADMSRSGLLNGGLSKYTETEVLTRFSYLHLILPRYRSFVAADFGAEVSLKQLFASVPSDWFDWLEMHALQPVEAGAGVSLARIPGVSLARLESVTKRQGGFVVGQSVVKENVAVTGNNTCVQFLPAGDGGDQDDAYHESAAYAESPVVLLSAGQSFLPAGRVTLSGYDIVVTFDPGTTVETRSGMIIRAPTGAVSIFLNGAIEVVLRPKDMLYDHISQYRVTTHFQHQVAVTCDSYAQGTLLCKWYRRRFDVLSTSARFFSAHAELLLLACPVVKASKPREICVGDLRDDEESGVGVGACSMPIHEGDTLIMKTAGPRVFGRACLTGVSSRPLLNNVLLLSDASKVATFTNVMIQFARIGIEFPFESDGNGTLGMEVVVPVDEYTIDRGGPSGSDGEYFDETGTSVSSKALDVLAHMRLGSPPVYTVVAVEPDVLSHRLGVYPTLRELLSVPAVMIDRDKLVSGGLVKSHRGWEITLDQPDVEWSQLAVWAQTWQCGFLDEDRFYDLLLRVTKVKKVTSLYFGDACA